MSNLKRIIVGFVRRFGFKVRGPITHVVAFAIVKGAENDVINAFRVLANAVPQVCTFEYGPNTSTEGLNQGCTHLFTLTFASDEDLQVYLPHRLHDQFKLFIKTLVTKAVVFDYKASK